MIQEPPAVQKLPTNKAGYRVPWFVAYIDDEPDFRVVRPRGITLAHRHNLCWICGEGLSAYKTFVVGPMCIINKVSAEPPSHRTCARYAAQVCPFLVRPSMRRRDVSDVEDTVAPAGVMIDRNPGVTALWTTKRYKPFVAPGGLEGVLFDIGDANAVEWWAHGRTATRQEVLDSLESGMPLLEQACEQDDDPVSSRTMLSLMRLQAMRFVPA